MRSKYKVLFVEPVGGHRGMHYYDFALCQALWEEGVDLKLLTCDETEDKGFAFPVERPFQAIYGPQKVVHRGWNYLMALGRIVRDLPPRPYVVHLHYFHIPFLDLLFIAFLKGRGAKIIITAHDVVPFHLGFLSKAILGWIYRAADRVILHAESNREEMFSLYSLHEDRLAVVPMGHYAALGLKHFSQEEAKGRLGLPEDSKIVLFFGQIKKVKGLDHLLKAFGSLSPNHPEALLLVVGPLWKEDLSRYEPLIAALGDKVMTRFEYVSDEEMSLYFSAAEVVVLPYTKVYQSAVLFMAFTFSRPVVASAVGGLAEVVEEGQTGYLVPPGDEMALAQAIDKVLSDKGKAEEMGRRAREMVEERFSWERIAQETKRVYEEVVAQGEGP